MSGKFTEQLTVTVADNTSETLKNVGQSYENLAKVAKKGADEQIKQQQRVRTSLRATQKLINEVQGAEIANNVRTIGKISRAAGQKAIKQIEGASIFDVKAIKDAHTKKLTSVIESEELGKNAKPINRAINKISQKVTSEIGEQKFLNNKVKSTVNKGIIRTMENVFSEQNANTLAQKASQHLYKGFEGVGRNASRQLGDLQLSKSVQNAYQSMWKNAIKSVDTKKLGNSLFFGTGGSSGGGGGAGSNVPQVKMQPPSIGNRPPIMIGMGGGGGGGGSMTNTAMNAYAGMYFAGHLVNFAMAPYRSFAENEATFVNAIKPLNESSAGVMSIKGGTSINGEMAKRVKSFYRGENNLLGKGKGQSLSITHSELNALIGQQIVAGGGVLVEEKGMEGFEEVLERVEMAYKVGLAVDVPTMAVGKMIAKLPFVMKDDIKRKGKSTPEYTREFLAKINHAIDTNPISGDEMFNAMTRSMAATKDNMGALTDDQLIGLIVNAVKTGATPEKTGTMILRLGGKASLFTKDKGIKEVFNLTGFNQQTEKELVKLYEKNAELLYSPETGKVGEGEKYGGARTGVFALFDEILRKRIKDGEITQNQVNDAYNLIKMGGQAGQQKAVTQAAISVATQTKTQEEIAKHIKALDEEALAPLKTFKVETERLVGALESLKISLGETSTSENSNTLSLMSSITESMQSLSLIIDGNKDLAASLMKAVGATLLLVGGLKVFSYLGGGIFRGVRSVLGEEGMAGQARGLIRGHVGSYSKYGRDGTSRKIQQTLKASQIAEQKVSHIPKYGVLSLDRDILYRKEKALALKELRRQDGLDTAKSMANSYYGATKKTLFGNKTRTAMTIGGGIAAAGLLGTDTGNTYLKGGAEGLLNNAHWLTLGLSFAGLLGPLGYAAVGLGALATATYGAVNAMKRKKEKEVMDKQFAISNDRRNRYIENSARQSLEEERVKREKEGQTFTEEEQKAFLNTKKRLFFKKSFEQDTVRQVIEEHLTPEQYEKTYGKKKILTPESIINQVNKEYPVKPLNGELVIPSKGELVIPSKGELRTLGSNGGLIDITNYLKDYLKGTSDHERLMKIKEGIEKGKERFPTEKQQKSMEQIQQTINIKIDSEGNPSASVEGSDNAPKPKIDVKWITQNFEKTKNMYPDAYGDLKLNL